MGNCLCCVVIDEASVGVVETLGKYDRIFDSGFHCINCFFDKVTYRPSLRLETFDTCIETITKDRISVTIKIGVQYKINNENITPPTIHPKQIEYRLKPKEDNDIELSSYSEKSKKVRRLSNNDISETSLLMLDNQRQNHGLSYQNAIVPMPSTDTNAIYQAVYKTRNPTGQMIQFIEAYFRGISCNYTMNDLFISKNNFSDELTSILNREMHPYGYIIFKALITDIDPPVGVKKAMNLVSESVNKREAIINNAEAEKSAKILRAEADSEVRRLEGEGLAKQRQALVEGLKQSVTGVCGDSVHMDPQQLTSTIVAMQYIDMIDRVGAQGKHTFIFSSAPNAAKTIEEQVRMAILSSDNSNNSL
jgi:regulator of protease activity HflC (stomatin/prohibitin superfamily)